MGLIDRSHSIAVTGCMLVTHENSFCQLVLQASPSFISLERGRDSVINQCSVWRLWHSAIPASCRTPSLCSSSVNTVGLTASPLWIGQLPSFTFMVMKRFHLDQKYFIRRFMEVANSQ